MPRRLLGLRTSCRTGALRFAVQKPRLWAAIGGATSRALRLIDHPVKEAHREYLSAIFAPREPEAKDEDARTLALIDACVRRHAEHLDGVVALSGH